MSDDDSDRRPERRAYDSPRRREQARETREQVAAAARKLFLERGWAGTTVGDVAAEAGVSEPTVYAAYGSKAGLASALVDSVNVVSDVQRMAAELEAARDDPAAQIAAIVAFDRRLFEANGDLIELMRDAGRTEPELAAAYREGRARGQQVRQRVLSAWPKGTLRAGLETDRAIDEFLALCNIDVYRVLTQERGWTAEMVEDWWRDSAARLLLADG